MLSFLCIEYQAYPVSLIH